MDHLALAVSDQARSMRFYEAWFGFVRESGPREDGVWILHDASGFSLAIGQIDEPVVLPPFFHFGRRGDTPEGVRAFRDRVDAAGVEIVEEWDEPDYVSVKLRDPDGYVIEVGWDAQRPDAVPSDAS
jgi:catechol 2,3-dioxygenase-like lactoylglutathione lyase family enzyme